MDPVTIAALAIAVAQVTGACIKCISKFVGPSQHDSQDLEDIKRDLYSFNAAITNLELHLEAHEEDQVRLNALSTLEEPLKVCKESLDLIQTRLKDVTFMRKMRNQVLGVRFDEKLKRSLRTLKMSRTFFDEVLHMDER